MRVNSKRRRRVVASTEFLLRATRSEEHTSELQSLAYLVCRHLLEKINTHPLHCTYFFIKYTATTEIYTPSLHDALPILWEAPEQLAEHHQPVAAAWKFRYRYDPNILTIDAGEFETPASRGSIDGILAPRN